MNAGNDVATMPGWYGKLPSLGDFASRRLAAEFIDPWDLWLGEGLQAQRDRFGDRWLEAYLHSPPWRFLLAPGAMPGRSPPGAVAGVLLPSMDRVGRHFPLTIATTIDRMPRIAAEFDALLAWMHRLEDTALDAVQGAWGIEDLEEALSALAPPGPPDRTAADDRLGGVRSAVEDALRSRAAFVDISPLVSRAELAAVFSGEPSQAETGARRPMPSMQGVTVWLADPPGRPQLLVSQGLPARDAFVRMFSGDGAVQGTAPSASTADADPAAPGLHLAEASASLDDPLATRPQPLGPAAAAVRAGPGDDLLSLFEAQPAGSSGAGVPPLPQDDILALFGAEATPAAPAPAAEGRGGEPDILALFGVPPAEPDSGKAH